MFLRFPVLVALFCAPWAPSLWSQQAVRTPSLAFGIQVVQPTGQFARIYDGYPAGIAGTFTAPLGRSPFEVGAGFAWNSMGSQEEDIMISVGTDAAGDEIHEEGTMRIRSNNYRYQVIGRFRPFTGAVQVYADAFAGFESYSTKTDLEFDNSGYTEVTDTQVHQRDHALQFGWAGGLRVRLSPGVFMEGRVEKVEGGLARYVDPQTISVDRKSSELEYEVRESETDKFTYQLGVAFQF